MNNLINSVGIITSLVIGNDEQQAKLTEADLLIKQVNLEQSSSEYIKTEFNSDNSKYIEKETYIKKQKKETKRLKVERDRKAKIAEEKRKKEVAAKLARRLVLQQEKKILLEREMEKKKEEEKKLLTPQIVSKPEAKQVSNGRTYRITHYTAFCSEGCTGRTASGYNVSQTIYYNGMRIVAADSSIPLFTKLRITYPNGNSFNAIVLDRGGAIKGNLLDVLVSSESEARALGRTTAVVEVLN